jgi:hypothetical protein
MEFAAGISVGVLIGLIIGILLPEFARRSNPDALPRETVRARAIPLSAADYCVGRAASKAPGRPARGATRPTIAPAKRSTSPPPLTPALGNGGVFMPYSRRKERAICENSEHEPMATN